MKQFFQRGLPQKIKEQAYFQKEKVRGFPKVKSFFQKMNTYPLDLICPLTHNQRIIHKMVTDRNPLLVITSDKVKVRDYIRKVLGASQTDEILIPLYHVSKTGNDIPKTNWDFEFFMKANHASGFNKLIKPEDNPTETQALAKYWLSQSFGQVAHAWAYRDIPRRIVCEKVIRTHEGKIPMDIKLYCFNGKVRMIMFLDDRFGHPSRIFTDENLREIPGAQMFGDTKMTTVPTFSTLGKMKEISEQLAQHFQYCRVDLFSLGEQIYFGELTHYTGAGIEKFDDWRTDRTFGELWKPENKHLSFFEMRTKLFPERTQNDVEP